MGADLKDGQEFFYRSEGRKRKALNAIRTQLGLAYLFDDDIDSASRILDLLTDLHNLFGIEIRETAGEEVVDKEDTD